MHIITVPRSTKMPTAKSFAKRRHATMACVSCRESKVKCDGVEPSCSNCASRNRECRYQAFDKRKLPLRVAIELLTSRVDQLCDFIRENGLQPPPLSQEKDTALWKVLEMLGLDRINPSVAQQGDHQREPSVNGNKVALPNSKSVPVAIDPSPTSDHRRSEAQQRSQYPTDELPQGFTGPQNSAAVDDHPPLLSLHRDVPGIQSDGDPSSWNSQVGTNPCIMPTSPYAHGFLDPSFSSSALRTAFEEIPEPVETMIADDDSTLVEEPSSPEDVEDLIDELSDRVGTLQIKPGGQTQFYGPTSTFNLADMLAATNSGINLAQNDALECLNRLGIHKAVPPALEEHLINLYFSWQDPSFHVVDRKIYEEAKVKWYAMGETPYYSESLRNAMCALGASFETRYHPNFVTFPESLVDFFGSRAKALLEVELDSPCIATVQALVICSSLEVGSGREARGWLYSGMAIRLAFNLALHVNMSSYVSSGVITTADADLRRTVFWAAYTVDHQLGFHLGRPFRTNMEDVTVDKPASNATRREHDRWTPYASPDSIYTSPGVPDCMEAVCEEQVNLCEIMAPCGDFLYGTSSISKVVLQSLNEKIVAKILDWKARLPPSLQINLDDHITPYVPQVLLLHMQYYQNIIYAHRPWMSKSHIQPQPPKGPGHAHAREMCIQSAIAIARILTMYETRYTLRRIHTKAVAITSSAVLLLLFAAVTQYRYQSDSRHGSGEPYQGCGIGGHLSTCFRALDEFAISWPNASRAKDLLLMLQRRWEIRTRPRKKGYGFDGGIPRPMKESTSIGTHGESTQFPEAQAPRVQPGQHEGLNIDIDIDWMLMPEGKSPSDSRAADLYSLLANPATMHPERGGV
ncbi:transcription factor domain-containing protein [Aspergillus undulatus]|uniref:transcription factor domain-containing protein n=1 Tax=Aspergillus undulatus TaxID=1810928 RepID=UPI003CCE39CD